MVNSFCKGNQRGAKSREFLPTPLASVFFPFSFSTFLSVSSQRMRKKLVLSVKVLAVRNSFHHACKGMPNWRMDSSSQFWGYVLAAFLNINLVSYIRLDSPYLNKSNAIYIPILRKGLSFVLHLPTKAGCCVRQWMEYTKYGLWKH
jgi:hypothetical protein